MVPLLSHFSSAQNVDDKEKPKRENRSKIGDILWKAPGYIVTPTAAYCATHSIHWSVTALVFYHCSPEDQLDLDNWAIRSTVDEKFRQMSQRSRDRAYLMWSRISLDSKKLFIAETVDYTLKNIGDILCELYPDLSKGIVIPLLGYIFKGWFKGKTEKVVFGTKNDNAVDMYKTMLEKQIAEMNILIEKLTQAEKGVAVEEQEVKGGAAADEEMLEPEGAVPTAVEDKEVKGAAGPAAVEDQKEVKGGVAVEANQELGEAAAAVEDKLETDGTAAVEDKHEVEGALKEIK